MTTTACPPGGGQVNGVSYGPVLNTAAVALTAFGNVPVERASTLIEILYGQQVSAGFVDRAGARLAQQLAAAGFGAAMQAALLAEPVLTADESPVEVVRPAEDPETGQPVPGSPHVMVIRTPDERLVWLTGLASRGYQTVIAALRSFAGHLIVDGYGAYQRLLTQAGAVLAGIQQCCQHVTRRCRGVAKLGPGTLQSAWTGEVTSALTEAHAEVQAAKARRDTAVDPVRLAALRARYDRAVDTGIIHNRHRDWDGDGNHPAFVLATCPSRIFTWIASMNTSGYTASSGRDCHSARPSITRSVIVVIRSLDTCAPDTSAGCAQISPCVSPLADNDTTRSSTPPSRRDRFGTIAGLNVPSRSRGTAMSTGPTSVNSVLPRRPLRELPPLRPTGSCLSSPRCSSISASSAASRNRRVSCCSTPPRPSSCTPWERACAARRDTSAGSNACAIASAVATCCSSTGPGCTGTAGSSTTAPAALLFSVVTDPRTMSSLSELHRFQDSPHRTTLRRP